MTTLAAAYLLHMKYSSDAKNIPALLGISVGDLFHLMVDDEIMEARVIKITFIADGIPTSHACTIKFTKPFLRDDKVVFIDPEYVWFRNSGVRWWRAVPQLGSVPTTSRSTLWCTFCKEAIPYDSFSLVQQKETGPLRRCLKHSTAACYNQPAVVHCKPRPFKDTEEEEGMDEDYDYNDCFLEESESEEEEPKWNIKKLVSLKKNMNIEVLWENGEVTFEPVGNLWEDIPDVVSDFLRSGANGATRTRIEQAWKLIRV